MSKEMRKHINTFKKFSLNENDGYTDKERKIIKLRELENELFSSTIKELIDSNNVGEMNKFVDYIQSFGEFNENLNISDVSESKITFYTKKSWDKPNMLFKRLYRNSFNVERIIDDVVYLSNDDNETLEITKDGKIINHYRNGHKMLQTYLVDDITLKELGKL